MASEEALHVVSIMRSARVTSNEAMAFMGQALTIAEQSQRGSAFDFIKELIEKRHAREFPDLSGVMR